MPCAKKKKKKVKEKKKKIQSETSVFCSGLSFRVTVTCYFYFGRKDVKVSFNHSEGKYIHLENQNGRNRLGKERPR